MPIISNTNKKNEEACKQRVFATIKILQAAIAPGQAMLKSLKY